jgi:hypothetical protein
MPTHGAEKLRLTQQKNEPEIKKAQTGALSEERACGFLLASFGSA